MNVVLLPTMIIWKFSGNTVIQCKDMNPTMDKRYIYGFSTFGIMLKGLKRIKLQ